MAAPLRWFPVYVEAVQSDEAYRVMPPEERGIFWDLLLWQWIETSIPDDVQKLRAGLGLKPRYYAALTRVLAAAFVPHGTPGRLSNARLSEVYNEQIGKSDHARMAALVRHRGRASRRRAAVGQASSSVRAGVEQPLGTREVEVDGEVETDKKRLAAHAGTNTKPDPQSALWPGREATA
jgi:hypothetical protein